MAGEQVEILPDTIRLTLGVKDVLLLSNADEVPHFRPDAHNAGPELPLTVRDRVDLQRCVQRACERAAQCDRRAHSGRAGWERCAGVCAG